MAGYWSSYFNENFPLSVTTGAKGTAAAKTGLADTLQWLRDNNRQAILIGPVPVYEKSVPLALALGSATNRNLLQLTTELEQRARNSPFYEVVSAVQPSSWFRFFDPIQWMCSGECITMRAGDPLYRDANHLSLAGAKAMQDKLAIGLGI